MVALWLLYALVFDFSWGRPFNQFLVATFWCAFALGWVPSLIAYSKVDYPERLISTQVALFQYALWGGMVAAAIPLLIGILSVWEIFAGNAVLADLWTWVILTIWFFIPGAIAGMVFGMLVPITLPSSRDDTRVPR
jgi:hypothetical protein